MHPLTIRVYPLTAHDGTEGVAIVASANGTAQSLALSKNDARNFARMVLAACDAPSDKDPLRDQEIATLEAMWNLGNESG